jgi:orotidine 5'-phosphate decarboxylase subfamily 1
MDKKKTNLALSADVTTKSELLTLADQVGAEICVLKTHIDILTDFDYETTTELKEIAKKHQFIIFEDRKFADIGNTILHQYQGGIYKIAEWADIINTHALPGPGIIQALKMGVKIPQRGCLIIAEMSSSGHLLDKQYQHACIQMAVENRDFVIGFISQHRLTESFDFIYMSPGIQIENKIDALGQQYTSPETAIIENKSDLIIVGRGIYKANDPVSAAKKYRERGWLAYLERCRQ